MRVRAKDNNEREYRVIEESPSFYIVDAGSHLAVLKEAFSKVPEWVVTPYPAFAGMTVTVPGLEEAKEFKLEYEQGGLVLYERRKV